MTESLLQGLQEIRDTHEHTRPIERLYLKKDFPRGRQAQHKKSTTWPYAHG